MHDARPGLPDLTIRQLEYLVAVADAPSWASAATEVGVSASALSQGLAELERRVGIPLFERDGRRRRFRPAAQVVLAHARQVVALTGDLADWAQRTRTGGSGRLRVGMIDAAAVGHYPDELRTFRADHPQLDLRLSVGPSAQLLDDLEAGVLDVVVCVEPPDPRPGIDTVPLLTEEIAVYAPDRGRPRRPATWGPWVLFPEGSHTRALAEAALRELGAPLEIVALGLGWTVLPVVQGELGTDALANGRVIGTRNLVTAIRRGASGDPAAQLLLHALSA
jgi:DNA-binding transcriptional LysR family regulator